MASQRLHGILAVGERFAAAGELFHRRVLVVRIDQQQQELPSDRFLCGVLVEVGVVVERTGEVVVGVVFGMHGALLRAGRTGYGATRRWRVQAKKKAAEEHRQP
ncbi:hypothetical protein L3D22_04070 [Lysobacter soli]|uniref:hypothetical protein n=1 Tax=Lysobacter soli TaxID=453783 RepID=UPI0020A0B4FF|nr:hypothetical protein [Lysobacter soli]UTA55028.1 hypothetical protein L3D22_04070 [Lysobacter soli]